MKRWIRASCPAQRASCKNQWFLHRRPATYGGGAHCAGSRLLIFRGCPSRANPCDARVAPCAYVASTVEILSLSGLAAEDFARRAADDVLGHLIRNGVGGAAFAARTLRSEE